MLSSRSGDGICTSRVEVKIKSGIIWMFCYLSTFLAKSTIYYEKWCTLIIDFLFPAYAICMYTFRCTIYLWVINLKIFIFFAVYYFQNNIQPGRCKIIFLLLLDCYFLDTNRMDMRWYDPLCPRDITCCTQLS